MRDLLSLRSVWRLISRPDCLAWRRLSAYLSGAHQEFLDCLFSRFMNVREVARRVARVLAYDERDLALVGLRPTGERGLPGASAFIQNGHWRNMLIRYMLGMYFGRGLRILDTCSGLGWGAYLVGALAKQVVAVELAQPALAFARNTWPTGRVYWARASVLHLPVPSGSFPVVLAMESVEHFALPEIRAYLCEVRRVLEPGGMLVGSTGVASNGREALAMRRTNPHHLHICTTEELRALLSEAFRSCYVIPSRGLFWAVK